jgi:protein TonB
MRKLLIAFLLLLSVCLHAQDSLNHRKITGDSIEARFPGGQDAWRAFLEEHVHPGVAARHKAPPGNYTVTVSFLVDKTGKVVQVQALNDPGYGTAEDTKKAIEHSPDWLPATINGKPVVYRQKQNITYQVTEK